jgi:AraC-like DNA-binding protein
MEKDAMKIRFWEWPPSASLAPFVELYWEGRFRGDASMALSMKVVPNGYVELILHLTEGQCQLLKENQWHSSGPAIIIGLYTQPYQVRFEQLVRVFGIRFKPEGLSALFGVPAAVFLEGFEDVSAGLGPDFDQYQEKARLAGGIEKIIALTERYLYRQFQRHGRTQGYIGAAAEQIRRNDDSLSIEALADDIFISKRQLEREFKNQLGISPKRYLRIQRFNRAQRLLEAKSARSLTELSYHCGYADQAHFIRDFRAFTGVNPTAFLRWRQEFIVNV